MKDESALERGRTAPKIGPSDSSDTYSDRPDEASTDSDSGLTGERVSAGADGERNAETNPDRVVDGSEAGLGGGLDQAEDAQLGATDEDLSRRAAKQKRKR